MAIKDTSKKPFIEDRDDNVFIGIDLPFRKSNGKEGYFASTSTTIEAVKNNIRNLVNTHQGERLMQPNLGINLRTYLFNQFTEDTEFELIKIDTQGSELDILKGGQNLVSKSSVVILEVSYVEYNLGSPLAEDVISYMKSINFDIYIEIGEHYSNEPQWKDVTVQKDLLFYRQESK